MAHRHGGGPSICRVQGSASTADDGVFIKYDFKAWAFPDSVVHWEVRCAMQAVMEHLYQKAQFRLAHWLRSQRGGHEALLLSFGLQYKSHMFPSQLSCRRRGQSDCLEEVKSEFSSTTVGLLNIFGCFFATQQKKKNELIVRALVESFFAQVISPRRMKDMLISNAHQCQVSCSAAPLEDGWCAHLSSLAERLRACPDMATATALFCLQEIYGELLALAEQCCAAKAIGRAWLRTLAVVIDERMASGSFNVEGVGLPTRPAKRMRLDSDFKQFISMDGLTEKRAKSGSILLRGNGLADPSVARKWEEQQCVAYQHAARSALSACSVVGVTSDGARLGDPPEETIVYMVYGADVEKGAIAPVQVLPDWHPGVRLDDDGRANPSDLAIWHKRSQAFLSGEIVGETGRTPNFQKQLVANVSAMRALDKALVGIGLSLSYFVAQRPARLLQPGERRYFCQAADLPLALGSASGFASRSCVENIKSGERRLETSWHSDRRVLVECLDAGSIGMPCRHFLFAAGGLRGWAMPDPPHVRYDHYKNALKRAGLTDAVHEGKIILGLSKGPWAGAAHHQTMKDAVANVSRTADEREELFNFLLPDMINDYFRGQPPPQAFHQDFRADMWQLFIGCPIFERKGSREKASRWFDWQSLMEPMLQWLPMLRYILLRIGIEQGWALKSEDLLGMPMAAVVGANEGEVPPAVERAIGEHGEDHLSVDDAEARAAMQERRKNTHNTMHLAAKILSTESSVRLLKMITVTARPTKREHSQQVVRCSTRAGGLEWWVEVASGKWLRSPLELVGMLADKKSLSEMGFPMCEYSATDPEFLTEGKMSDSLFGLVVELLSAEVSDMQYWSHNFPGKFGALLAHDKSDQKAALDVCMSAFKALEVLEALKADDVFFENLWVNLMWPQQCWPREVLLAVRENNGESLPGLVRDELIKVGRCMKTTRGCEMLFNHLRECERLQTASKMGRQARWHRCISSTVSRDMDRRPVKAQSIDFAATVSQKLPPSTFSQRKAEFSLGEETCEQLRGAKTWASPKPDKLKVVADMTCALLQAVDHPLGLQALKLAWFGMLADTGAFLVADLAGAHMSGIVVSISPWLVIVWKCNAHIAQGGKRFWRLDVSEQALERVLVTDLVAFRALDVHLLTPAISRAHGFVDSSGALLPGCIIAPQPGAEPMPLLEFGARRCFKNLTMTQLRDLIEAAPLRVQKPYPRRELDLVMACIYVVLPELELSEIEASAHKHRGCKQVASTWGSAINSTNLAHIEGLLDNDDAACIRARVHQQEVAAAVSAGKTLAQKKGPRRPRRLVALQGQSFSKEQAAAWLPQVVGCTISKDTRLHGRWKVSYPCDTAPFVCSKVWNAERSERAALFFVLRWAWAAHTQKVGEPCPYDLLIMCRRLWADGHPIAPHVSNPHRIYD